MPPPPPPPLLLLLHSNNRRFVVQRTQPPSAAARRNKTRNVETQIAIVRPLSAASVGAPSAAATSTLAVAATAAATNPSIYSHFVAAATQPTRHAGGGAHEWHAATAPSQIAAALGAHAFDVVSHAASSSSSSSVTTPAARRPAIMKFAHYESPTVIAPTNMAAVANHFQLESSSVIKTAPPGRGAASHFSPKHEALDLTPLVDSNLQVRLRSFCALQILLSFFSQHFLIAFYTQRFLLLTSDNDGDDDRGCAIRRAFAGAPSA